MLLEHPEHQGRGVRLAYCMNLHPATDLDGVLAGMREITLPLAQRLGSDDLREGFGVGMWLPADVALDLTAEPGSPELERLISFLAANRLDPFTFNAFPYAGFHDAGLKERVFRPTWKQPERLAFSLSVARIGTLARAEQDFSASRRSHLSLSTHTGMYAAWAEGEEDVLACAENLAVAALHLAQLEEETGQRAVLSLEPEPRSLANDTSELPGLFERVRVCSREVMGRGYESLRELAETVVRDHIGTCLDTCHAAVEFERPLEAFERSTMSGTPIGKIQFSSALSLPDPDTNEEGRALLLGMDEPVYLHQVTGRRGPELLRVADLPELRERWQDGDWRGCDEWRCHFHVPVDRATIGARENALAPRADTGLRTTRSQADAVLAAALADPGRWGTQELHVEIETYTWDVMGEEVRGAGELVDDLEREYAYVLARLAEAGWTPARAGAS